MTKPWSFNKGSYWYGPEALALWLGVPPHEYSKPGVLRPSFASRKGGPFPHSQSGHAFQKKAIGFSPIVKPSLFYTKYTNELFWWEIYVHIRKKLSSPCVKCTRRTFKCKSNYGWMASCLWWPRRNVGWVLTTVPPRIFKIQGGICPSDVPQTTPPPSEFALLRMLRVCFSPIVTYVA